MVTHWSAVSTPGWTPTVIARSTCDEAIQPRGDLDYFASRKIGESRRFCREFAMTDVLGSGAFL
jgi:hypothetical protein